MNPCPTGSRSSTHDTLLSICTTKQCESQENRLTCSISCTTLSCSPDLPQPRRCIQAYKAVIWPTGPLIDLSPATSWSAIKTCRAASSCQTSVSMQGDAAGNVQTCLPLQCLGAFNNIRMERGRTPSGQWGAKDLFPLDNAHMQQQ